MNIRHKALSFLAIILSTPLLTQHGYALPTSHEGKRTNMEQTKRGYSTKHTTPDNQDSTIIFATPSIDAIPYRIPAIATAYDGTLVATADYRYSRVDIGSGRIDLHIRRSHDNGKTWEEIQKPATMQGDGNTTAGHQEAGFGDPCIVGDIESPRMMITSCSGTPGFFGGTRNHHQGWARWYSYDNGATWGEPTYIDEKEVYSKFDKSQYGPIKGWFIGSGRIAQSTTTKVGKYYRLYLVGSSYNGKQTANWMLYSDDFGETWDFLGGCDVSPIPGGDEPKAEELPDGSILLSSRTGGGRNFNIYSYTDTKTGAGSWLGMCYSGAANNGVVAQANACNGEVMLVPVVRTADKKEMFLLLQSVPFGPGRTNVGIYYKELASLSDFSTPENIASDWTGRYQVSQLPSAYSTMTWQKNNTIGFVYEEETFCNASGGGYSIVYKNYTIDQLTRGAYRYKAKVNRNSFTSAGIEGKMEEILDEKHFGTRIGQYQPSAKAFINKGYNAYKHKPKRNNYEALNASIQTAPRTEIEEGRYYRLRNCGRGNQDYYLTVTDTIFTATKATGKDNQVFQFVSDGKGGWAIRCKAGQTYLGQTAATEAQTTTSATPVSYTIASNTEGKSSLRCLTPSVPSYPYIHLANDNTRIVCWLAGSPSNNAASYWYIESLP